MESTTEPESGSSEITGQVTMAGVSLPRLGCCIIAGLTGGRRKAVGLPLCACSSNKSMKRALLDDTPPASPLPEEEPEIMGSGRTCEHVVPENLRKPTPSDSVYREDCTQCFDSIDDPTGLDLCLKCFNGGCTGINEHAQAHYKDTDHPLVLNIRRTRKIIERDEPPLKISKLAIAAETESDRYDTILTVKCLTCGEDDLDRTNPLIAPVIDSIMTAATFARKEEIKEWELELETCEHIVALVTRPTEGPNKYASVDTGKCSGCELNENLWLCLECCKVGCGRDQSQWGGLEGAGHAAAHYKDTGHHLTMKLGSLAADTTPDVYCYACPDGGQEVVHPQFRDFLAKNGLDLAGRRRTEKTITELSIESNLNWDFSMKDQDGKEAVPLFGPGLTGLRNMGNTCYLASILQCLYDMPSFQQRFNLPAPKTSNPARDLETQMRKIGDGLLSGRYAKPDSDVTGSEHPDHVTYQKGLTPAMLKHLIGQDHDEFSSSRQQDAYEFLQYLITKIAELKHPEELGDPLQPMRFVMEQRLQCKACNKIRYSSEVNDNILINVPQEKLPQEKLPLEDGEEKAKYKPVTLKECLDIFTASEDVDLTCSSCKGQGFTKSHRFKTFPEVLTVVARKIVELGPGNYAKVDVPVVVADEPFDMEDSYFSAGPQPDEEVLVDEPTAAEPKAPAFAPNQEALAELLSMGFPESRCVKGLFHTGNSDSMAAITWVLEHMEDPDIDEPLNAPALQKNGAIVNEDDVQNLLMIGMWDELTIRKALFKHGGDVQTASNGLFEGNSYDDVNLPEPAGHANGSSNRIAANGTSNGAAANGTSNGTAANGAGKETPGSAERPAKFELQSIVCHKGGSIHAGHYVAFIRKKIDGKPSWVLFNDEKVAKAVDAEEMKKSAYIYFFKRV